MRKNYLNIIFPALALLLFSQACDDSALTVDRHEISFSASIESVGPQTKALLESEDILTDGSKVKIYGFATKTTGAVDIPGHLSDAAGSTKLNDGQVITYDDESGSWNYDSGEAYQWQAQADHRFFGWMTYDAKSNLTAPSVSLSNDGKITVPATSLGINAGNFDFAYSDVVVRTAASADYSTVELPLEHLYASFSLAARNYTKEPVYVKSVTIHGLMDAKGATVTFGADAASVAYGTGSRMSATNLVSGGDVLLAKAGDTGDAKVNIVYGASDTPKYFLVWPQTGTEMTPATEYADGWAPGTNEPYMEIVYSQGSSSATQMTAKVPIPHDTGDDDDSLNGWPAGTRHNMELSFSDRLVKLGVYAGDWDEKDPVIDYEGAVSVTQTLRIASGYESNCVLSDDGKTAYFKAGYPIILQFKIDRPLNATWLVTRGGAFDVVEIDNFTDGDSSVIGDGDDTFEGLVDDTHISKIALIPRIKELQKNEYKVSLSFSVRLNSGEVVNIDDLIFNDTAETGKPVSPRTLVLLK